MSALSTFALVSLVPAFVFAQGLSPAKVDVVIGGLMSEEGGHWAPKSSPLLRPFGVDFDSAGRMFVVELEGGRVHRLGSDGELLQVSGDGSKSYRGDGGPFGDATYNGMHNVAATPNGDLYIADSWNHCVRRLDASANTISTFAGTGGPGFSGDDGLAANAGFDFIMCVSLNPANDILHVADLKNRRVRAIDLSTGTVSTIAGNGRKGRPVDGHKAIESPLEDPRAVAADSKGNVYVLERNGNVLRVVKANGTIHTVAGSGKRGFADGPALSAEFGSPKHICVDDKDNVYIADDQNKAIRKYDPISQTVQTILGRGYGDKKLKLLNPHGVCWQQGWLYVVDTGHNRILRLKPGS